MKLSICGARQPLQVPSFYIFSKFLYGSLA